MNDSDKARQAMIDGLRVAAAAGHVMGARLEDMQALFEAAWVTHKQLTANSEPTRFDWMRPPPRHLRIVR